VQRATDAAVTAVVAVQLADVKGKIIYWRGVTLKFKSGHQSVLLHVQPAAYLWFMSLKVQGVPKKTVQFSKPQFLKHILGGIFTYPDPIVALHNF